MDSAHEHFLHQQSLGFPTPPAERPRSCLRRAQAPSAFVAVTEELNTVERELMDSVHE
jgi:hypothetical protein